MELIDIYNAEREFTGKILPRDTELKEGEYWLYALIWVVNGRGELLVTLRSEEKKSWGGYWENQGGAVQSGEDSRTGAARELFEETGIKVSPGELCLLSSRRWITAFHDTYAVKRDIGIEEIKLQPGETDDARWVSLAQLEEMCSDGRLAAPVAEAYERNKPKLTEFIEKCRFR